MSRTLPKGANKAGQCRRHAGPDLMPDDTSCTLTAKCLLLQNQGLSEDSGNAWLATPVTTINLQAKLVDKLRACQFDRRTQTTQQQ